MLSEQSNGTQLFSFNEKFFPYYALEERNVGVEGSIMQKANRRHKNQSLIVTRNTQKHHQSQLNYFQLTQRFYI